MCGPSASESALADSSASFSNTLNSNYNMQLAGQQAALALLNTSLSPTVAAGPGQKGWTPFEEAAVNTNILNTTAANYQNARQAGANALAGRGGGAGNADLVQSGIDQQIQAGIASKAAGQTASEENQATIQNYQQGLTNYNNAIGNEEKVASLYDPTSYGSLALSGNKQAFGEAGQITQEKNQLAKDIAGAAVGVGSSLLGGFGNLDTTGSSSFGEQVQNFLGGMNG